MEKLASGRRKLAPKPVGGRGRPARLSREAILQAAAAMLDETPGAPPSLNGIARALGVTPMAIYTYFESRDELWQALSDALLADFELQLPPEAEPCETIALWAHAMRAHFQRRPQLIDILNWEGGHSSVSWLRRGVVVADALAALGLEGEGLARATLWVWQVVMSAIHVELRSRSAPLTLAAEEFAQLAPEVQRRVGLMQAVQARPDHDDAFFAYQVDRTLDAVRLLTVNKT